MSPKFSIVLPVKNGGNLLKLCIQSILSQTYSDFNLFILDNASIDGTTEWLESLKDTRIKIFRSEKPLNIEDNWGRILELPLNKFSTLIGHDDILNSDYLQVMNNLIEEYPEATLYQTHFNYVDKLGNSLRLCQPMQSWQTGDEFLKSFLRNKVDLMGTGFMFRSEDYKKINGIPNYPNLLFADFELWIRLSIMEGLAVSPKNCFSFRIHNSVTSVSNDMKYQLSFERFIKFLVYLKNTDTTWGKIIEENGHVFLYKYCKGLAHRMLRTPLGKRENTPVKVHLNNCNNYALQLGANFNTSKHFYLNSAKFIDSNLFTRNLFFALKKVFKKPIIK